MEKVWGQTTELFRNNTTSTHYLEIKKGGYCSEHRHAQKSNIFYVIEGEFEVVFWDVDGEKRSIIVTLEMEAQTLLPNTWHKFKALTDVKCIEIYEYLYDGVDIERRATGGL